MLHLEVAADSRLFLLQSFDSTESAAHLTLYTTFPSDKVDASCDLKAKSMLLRVQYAVKVCECKRVQSSR